jgi:quercetin dioxygenase-like cupin family protein
VAARGAGEAKENECDEYQILHRSRLCCCRHRDRNACCRSSRRNGHAALRVPGKSLVAQFVDYAPGGASLSHTHAKSAFIFAYVVSGEIESQVNDGPKRVYRAGESWYETPGSVHRVSRNASTTVPAKLLAVLVVDTDDKNLTTPLK